MDKILFIVPPNIKYEDFVNPPDNVKKGSEKLGNRGAVITDMPLGILSMSAYVKKFTTADIRLVDFNIVLNKLETFEFCSFANFFWEYFSAAEWLDFAPNIIGISALFTTSYRNFLDIAHQCRDIFPSAIIIGGGGVPTNMHKEIFRDSACFDALCYGEGERPMLALIKAVNKLHYFEENPSWITREKSESGQLFQHDFIENLDEIPLCDYDLFERDSYNLNPTISAYTSINAKKQIFPVMTSRGCVFHCCFCSSHTVHGRKIRYYSINRVREDLKRLKEEYGAEIIIFQDDHFMGNKKRAFGIVNMLKELKMIAFFPNSLALYALDRKMLEALKSIGVNQLVLSIESGSNRVLKEIMHKPLNLSIVKRVVDDCRELGIYTDANILIGLPGERRNDIEDTRYYLRTINANWFRINVATPLVGSEMFDICIENNYIKGSYVDFNYKRAVVETEDFTAAYIQEMAYVLNLELNFVENSDFRLGNYEIALKGFENAIKAKSDHVLGYYYAAKCYEKLGNFEKALQYMNIAKMEAEKPFWRKYLDMFNIQVKRSSTVVLQ